MDGETAPPKATQGNEDLAVTPLEILISFFTQLKNASNLASASVPDAMRTLISQSLELASGMMTYPLAVSSGISTDAQLLANETKAFDFEALNNEALKFSTMKKGMFKFCKEMSSNLLQVQVLKMLIRMSGAQRVLEIGTFTGFAALNMAEALPSDGHLVTMEILPNLAQFARDFFSRTAQSRKIEVQEGSALELLEQIAKKGESFDFIFIDAFKSDNKNYLKIVLDNNILAPKGTMLFDNTIFKGTAYMEDYPIARFAVAGPTVHKFNQILQNETRVEQVMLPICDGVTIVRRTGE